MTRLKRRCKMNKENRAIFLAIISMIRSVVRQVLSSRNEKYILEMHRALERINVEKGAAFSGHSPGTALQCSALL